MAIVLAVLALCSTAHADYPPITDGNYSIELYDGVALGNSATIAMGGASVANGTGSSGTLTNVAASVVRPATDHDSWSWDYHFDYLNGSLSKDYTNSGFTTSDAETQAITFGLAYRERDWAIAGTVFTDNLQVDADLRATTTRAQLAASHWIPEAQIAVGVGLDVASFEIDDSCRTGCPKPVSITGAGGADCSVWIPAMQSLRIGTALTSGISNSKVDPGSSSSGLSVTPPSEVVEPWQFRIGGAYRIAASEWNQPWAGDFRDEEALVLVADAVITGASTNAYGLVAFGQNELQPAGLSTSVSLRGGAEYEVLPGRLRLRAGSYWEPGRFEDVSGRIHATFGTELRFLAFSLFGHRRLQLTLTGDVASRYRNASVSIGFWH